MPNLIKVPPMSSAQRDERKIALLKKKARDWSRAKKWKAFAKGTERVHRTLGKFPRKMWGFTARKGNWTITQVLWHLADQEANLYVRLRRAIAEPGQMISSYDQNKWSDKLLYSKSDPEQAKALLLLLRKANADFVKRIPSKAWGNKVKHQEWGPLSLENLVFRNIWHLEHHLYQMGRRHTEWKSGE